MENWFLKGRYAITRLYFLIKTVRYFECIFALFFSLYILVFGGGLIKCGFLVLLNGMNIVISNLLFFFFSFLSKKKMSIVFAVCPILPSKSYKKAHNCSKRNSFFSFPLHFSVCIFQLTQIHTHSLTKFVV